MLKIINTFFGGNKSTKEVQTLQPIVRKTNEHVATYATLSNDELRANSERFRDRIRKHLATIDQKISAAEQEVAQFQNDANALEQADKLFKRIHELKKERDQEIEKVLWDILPEAFATMKETARRFKENTTLESTALPIDLSLSNQDYIQVQGNKAIYKNTWNVASTPITWDMVHYDVQLLGGVILHKGKIAEMATGEGKTLVSTLPAYLNALAGEGVHIVTVNEYLAKRDSEWNAPLFSWLGITVGCIDKYEPNSEERKNAYLKDICYGTNNEFGFDYLRDNMVRERNELTQRKHHYAIIDEVDSVLIDDARTPLIISGPVTESQDRQTYLKLKPQIAVLVEAQRQLVSQFLLDAKKKLAEGKDSPTEAGFELMKAYKGLPKNSALIKLLSEQGIRVKLQKAESYYLAEQQKEMHKVEESLYFVIDEKNKSIHLTDKGIKYLAGNDEDTELFVLPDLSSELDVIEKNTSLSDEEKVRQKDKLVEEYSDKSDKLHSIQQLLKAYTLFQKDVEYVVVEGQVKIVDEQTGRIMEGRRYSDGLHQALEAKENVNIEASSQTYATISLQNYFRMYHKLAGMTGTAETESAELWDIYKLDVTVIPTNKPIVRLDQEDLIYKTKREKYKAIIEAIEENRSKGRPILVGTTSVETSELLSKMLTGRKIKHNVLNAKQHQREAAIIAEAGLEGAVTIATNMAGRGTDIKLGPNVKEHGGLVIIGTERHESRRVDRQLRGRAGRQGDPGMSQFYVSLEDDLMRLFGSERIAKWMDKLGLKEGEVIQHSMVTSSITRAQKKVEENNFGIRKRLLDYDDVMNKQRSVIYQKRRNALEGDKLFFDIDNAMYAIANSYCEEFEKTNDKRNFEIQCLMSFGIDTEHLTDKNNHSPKNLTSTLYQLVNTKYDGVKQKIVEETLPIFRRMHTIHGDKENINVVVPYSNDKLNIHVPTPLQKAIETEGKAIVAFLERALMLSMIDQLWKEHLRSMEQLRHSVQTAYLEQKDPLVIYKIEAFNLFDQMTSDLNQRVISFLLHAHVANQQTENISISSTLSSPRQRIQATKNEADNLSQPSPYNDPSQSQIKNEPIKVENRIGRNDPCHCGSGKKYKHCHGKVEHT